MEIADGTDRGPRRPQPAASTRSAVFAFVAWFGILLVVGNLLLSTNRAKAGIVEPCTMLNATGAAVVARWMGIGARATGVEISYGECTLNARIGRYGEQAFLILASSLLAFPSRWRHRLIGVLVGTATLFCANFIRLVCLVVIAKYLPSWLELSNQYVGQILIVLIVSGYFVLWVSFPFGRWVFAGSSGSGSAQGGGRCRSKANRMLNTPEVH